MKMQPDDFFAWLAPSAVRICNEYGLYPSVCMAQAAIESGWGEYVIGEYNIFGRKAVSDDESIMVETQEQDRDTGEFYTITAPFKAYHSLDDAVRDYCILLTEEPAYLPALIFIGKNRDAYIDAMATIYATRETYPDDIKVTIKANELSAYDKAFGS